VILTGGSQQPLEVGRGVPGVEQGLLELVCQVTHLLGGRAAVCAEPQFSSGTVEHTAPVAGDDPGRETVEDAQVGGDLIVAGST